MAKVFVSYSHKDIDFAKHLTEEFIKKNDLDFWVDWEGIPPTVDGMKKIQSGIEESDIFLFLLSPDGEPRISCTGPANKDFQISFCNSTCSNMLETSY